MKAPKSLFDRPGRATAVVGGVVAASATAVVALVSGTAAATPDAAEPGRCTKNVNVRAQPDVTSQIVALCEEGTKVKVGEKRAGFLQLTNLGGWAAQEYISVNGRAPAPAARAIPEDDGEDDGGSDGADDSSADRDDDDNDARSSRGRTRGSDSADSSADSSDAGSDESGADDSSTDDSSTDDSDTDDSETDGSGTDDSGAGGPSTGGRSGGLGGLLG